MKKLIKLNNTKRLKDGHLVFEYLCICGNKKYFREIAVISKKTG